jgi:superfamily I DNA and/or RNA helicase
LLFTKRRLPARPLPRNVAGPNAELIARRRLRIGRGLQRKAPLGAFPCIIAGLRDYAEFIPLERELFDLVIIDEASQVSIAQALPAIIRAKKVLVLGDRNQFGNVKTSNASHEVNAAYMQDLIKAFSEDFANVGQEVRTGSRSLST